MKAQHILRHISSFDIYSSARFCIPSPTREHVVPSKYLSPTQRRDLNNIFVCTAAMNTLRGTLPYDTTCLYHPNTVCFDGTTGWPLESLVWSGPDVCIKNKESFTPPIHSRGAIARSCMYMLEQYPSLGPCILDSVMSESTMRAWDALYPVQKWEVCRSLRIARHGFPLNVFVVQHWSVPQEDVDRNDL